MGSGPLQGVRVVELGGIGPAPFCCMLLADMGAEVVRIERSGGTAFLGSKYNLLHRGRRSLRLDLKHPQATDAVRRLVGQADVLVEGFRPGVAERLGLGPDACLAINPRLVYGRMTGWGQDGPLAQMPGHDLNYIALTGALHAIGPAGGPPVVPLNLIGDFGGGALYLAFGLLAGIIESRASGKGQVVDAAMVDGAASLMTLMYGMFAGGLWQDRRGVNRLDSGAPWYSVYETADGKHVAVGCNEPAFFAGLLRMLGLDAGALPDQHDTAGWPAMRESFAALFRQKTRDAWSALAAAQGDVCLSPVLSLGEAPHHPHLAARGTFVEADGVVQPAPAPRFSRTPGALGAPPGAVDDGGDAVLRDWGFTAEEVADLRGAGALG